MKVAQPIRDNWYEVIVSLWKYDRNSAKSFPQQAIEAINRPRDIQTRINIFAASNVDAAYIVWTLYASDDDVLQWSLNGVRLAGTKADYQNKYGVDGELDT